MDTTVLYVASANNRIKTAEYLLNVRKVDPNIAVSEALTAAHVAAMVGNDEILKLLVNIDNLTLSVKDQFGETPLFQALGQAPDEKLEKTIRLLPSKR